jgi:hypothetical protein
MATKKVAGGAGAAAGAASSAPAKVGAEVQRLSEDAHRGANWKRWGPYVSERQWGTVREDYSADGSCWTYFSHDQARSRAYRWGEDGILGITDRQCRLCFALCMWNGRDPILKERLFGLTGPEGNHGEDCKENYYYLDSTPTHSYMKGLYKYPYEYPYQRICDENRRRGKADAEFELDDTGVFDEGKFFDVFAEYAKAGQNDILIRVTIANRGSENAEFHFLPTLWFRNSWSWGCSYEGCELKPRIAREGPHTVYAEHCSILPDDKTLPDRETKAQPSSFGPYRWYVEPAAGADPELLFTDNETNHKKCFGAEENPTKWVKDAFHDYVIGGKAEAVNRKGYGTKVAAWYKLTIPAGKQVVVRLRLADLKSQISNPFGPEFDKIFAQRIAEADEFYNEKIPPTLSPEQKHIARQAYAGMLWSKQFYHYVVDSWLKGDPWQPPPPDGHSKWGRNREWAQHLFNRDIISMPDKWEYPWYAAWDLAFHSIPFARVDPYFAKEQLILMLREWYMHPNGQLPAYEFAFSDVNPPVHAWAVWRVYKMTGPKGRRDRLFLARAFQKLLINFTWWVNRKDVDGKNVFGGGFLGLDNIGVFDRSRPLPGGGTLQQADGTAWMAFFCSTMLSMALELASEDPEYEDVASKFFEHFVAITDAINTLGGSGLWDETDGFYYDQLLMNGQTIPLRVRSMVGIVPLFTCDVLEDEVVDRLPGFKKRMEWFLEHRQDLAKFISFHETSDDAGHEHTHHMLAIPSRERLVKVLSYVLDEKEFLSPYGIRSLSKVHEKHPYVLTQDGQEYRVDYVPGESNTYMFGGNSNWRGPIWLPVNYILVEVLERYHFFYGDTLKVEYPTGSGRKLNLKEISQELGKRLINLFMPESNGRRPCHGDDKLYWEDPSWRDLILFYEYFHGDNGRGVGASHQTGWTGVVADLIHRSVPKPAGEQKPAIAASKSRGIPKPPPVTKKTPVAKT